MILDAARHALDLHQWLTAPDFDQEGEVKRAEKHLAAFADHGGTPPFAAARGLHAWLGANGHDCGNGHGGRGARPPVRTALVRTWTRSGLLRAPVPLTSAAALRADISREEDAWVPAFLTALAGEAEDGLQRLMELERAWLPPAVPSPTGGAIRARPPRWTSWPRPRCSPPPRSRPASAWRSPTRPPCSTASAPKTSPSR